MRKPWKIYWNLSMELEMLRKSFPCCVVSVENGLCVCIRVLIFLCIHCENYPSICTLSGSEAQKFWTLIDEWRAAMWLVRRGKQGSIMSLLRSCWYVVSQYEACDNEIRKKIFRDFHSAFVEQLTSIQGNRHTAPVKGKMFESESFVIWWIPVYIDSCSWTESHEVLAKLCIWWLKAFSRKSGNEDT